MLKINNFIKKYIDKKPHVTKHYAVKKYKKAFLLFGTTNKRSRGDEDDDDNDEDEHINKRNRNDEDEEYEEGELKKILKKRDIDYDEFMIFFQFYENDDTLRRSTIELYINLYLELIQLLHDRDFNRKKFFDFVKNNYDIDLIPENYDDIFQEYSNGLNVGTISPQVSLEANQRGNIRLNPKCKLYDWMNEIAPNESIPEHVNILTDDKCRYYYMFHGLHYLVTTKMIQKLKSSGLEWTDKIFPESVHNNDSLKNFLQDPQFKLSEGGVGTGHAVLFIKYYSENEIFIVNPHGKTTDKTRILNSISPELFQKYKFTFYEKDLSDQGIEGSCALHSFIRLVYIAFRLQNNTDYDDYYRLQKYLNKKIPCQFAIFVQNLKYICENELDARDLYKEGDNNINTYRKYNSEEETIRRAEIPLIVNDTRIKEHEINTRRILPTDDPELREELFNFQRKYAFQGGKEFIFDEVVNNSFSTEKFNRNYNEIVEYSKFINDLYKRAFPPK